MQKLVWKNANGVTLDLTSGNYGITEWEGFSNASLNVQTQTVPFQDGAVFLDALVEQRELSVTLAMQDKNNLELRYQQRREIISALNPKLGEGYLIYTNDFITKQIKCVPQIPIFETHNSDTAGTPKASLSWTACNPYWEDLEETVVDFSNGDIKTIQNEGDVKIGIELEGNLSNEKSVFKNITTKEAIRFNNLEQGQYYISTLTGNKTAEKIKSEVEMLMKICTSACIGRNGDLIILTYNLIGIVRDLATIEYKSITNMPSFGSNPKIEYCENNDTYYIGGRYGLYTTENFDTVTRIIEDGFMLGANYYKDKYIALTENGYIYTSTDGVSFSKVNTGIYFTSVVYSEEKNLFVGVGGASSNIVIATSSDGVTWTQVDLSLSGYLHNVIYDSSREIFIAVGNGGMILTSSNGTVWTQRTSGVNTNFTDVACNEKYIISAGEENTLISEDSINWTLIDEKFMLIFYNNWFIGIDSSCGTKYSTNGKDYITAIETGGLTTTQNIRDMKIFGNKMMCYGQWYNSVRLMITEDEWETWQTYTIESYDNSEIKFTFAQNKNLYVYIAGTKICTSSDLENWTVYDAGELLADITYSEEKELFVVVGVDHLYTSSNGTSWTASVTQEYSLGASITYSNYYHKFYLADVSYLYSSENGTDWVIALNNIETQQYWRIKTDGGIIALTGIQQLVPAIYTVFTRNGSDWNVAKVSGYTTEDLCIYNKLIYISVYTEGGKMLLAIKNPDSYWIAKEFYFNGSILTLVNYGDIFYYGGTSYIAKDAEGKEENCIDKLTTDSNMNLGLEQGTNKLMFENINGNIVLKYRQKYIGV